MPRPIGSVISIVGALVIGEAAVSAGLIGAPMVIVIAITAIASFVVPAQSDLAALLRILLTIFAGFLGFFGIIIVLLGTLIHISALRSFGNVSVKPSRDPRTTASVFGSVIPLDSQPCVLISSASVKPSIISTVLIK